MLGTASGIWRQNLKRETGESRSVMQFALAFGTDVFWGGRKRQQWVQPLPLEQGRGNPGLRNVLGEGEGGEETDLAAGSPDALVVAAQP